MNTLELLLFFVLRYFFSKPSTLIFRFNHLFYCNLHFITNNPNPAIQNQFLCFQPSSMNGLTFTHNHTLTICLVCGRVCICVCVCVCVCVTEMVHKLAHMLMITILNSLFLFHIACKGAITAEAVTFFDLGQTLPQPSITCLFSKMWHLWSWLKLLVQALFGTSHLLCYKTFFQGQWTQPSSSSSRLW